MNMLFITGPGRSGTSAFGRYMNEHPEILVCVERYKGIRHEVTPSLFTYERLLDYRKGETNTGINRHARLLNKKDPAKLAWIGDKAPGYVKDIRTVAENNPRSRFIVMHRPIEEVVESYVARSLDPDDRWLGGKDGFSLGIRDWNQAARNTRKFARSPGMGSRVLVLGYHDFFGHNEACIPLISRFLDLDFDEGIRERWKKTSTEFEGERRRKDSLSEEQKEMLRRLKDEAADDWMLKRIEEQWANLESSEEDEPINAPDPGWSKVADELASMEIESQSARIRRLERRIARLEEKARGPKQNLVSVWSPAARKLLGKGKQLRARVMGGK